MARCPNFTTILFFLFMVFADFCRNIPRMRYFKNSHNLGPEWCFKTCKQLPVTSVPAIPLTRDYYKCMVQSAGGDNVPFWTGLHIDHKNTLTGLYERHFSNLPVFGIHPRIKRAHPRIKSIFWTTHFGAERDSRFIYLHHGLYVATTKHFRHRPPIGCVCQDRGT